MIIYYTGKFAGGREESRRLLERAIAVHTGDEEQAKTLIGELKKGEYGKPYIEDFCCFSISHTGSIWAALFADRECGLDIQLSRKCDIMGIARRFFAPPDAAKISSDDDFFHLWARREALTKAIGGSVYDTDLPAVSSCSAVKSGKRYTIRDICLPDMPELYAAVCLEGDPGEADPEFRVIQTVESQDGRNKRKRKE